jgi:glycerate dehydrogenase
VVVLTLPLTEQTRNLFNKDLFAVMKPGAIFVNVARGAVTDEAALADALAAGALGGLGVDVFSAEPLPEDHPFSRIMDRDNVIFTPHCAWSAQEARNRCIREVADNIRAFARGESRNRCC